MAECDGGVEVVDDVGLGEVEWVDAPEDVS
jgi:hypothetical protein